MVFGLRLQTFARDLLKFSKTFYCSGQFISGTGLGLALSYLLSLRIGFHQSIELLCVGVLLMGFGGWLFRRRAASDVEDPK